MANRHPGPRGGGPARRRGSKPGGPVHGPKSQRRPEGRGPAKRPVQGPGPGPGPAPAAPRGRPARAPQRPTAGPIDGPERLQKVLAHAGVGSRRACEELILQGRVTVDNQVVRELGTRVDPRAQQVAVDGQKIHAERPVYFAVHKPKGYVSTNSDPAGKPRVVDILPEIPQRVYSVGRLDEQSTGLMLLTNDGALANRLAHPKFGVEKVYRVVVAGEPPREVLDQLTQGIWLAEGKVRAKRVRLVGRKGQASVLEMVLAEGKNREIRRMMARLGHKVMSLTRIAVGPIGLKGLGVGEYRPLTGQELDLLRQVAAGMSVPAPRFPDRRPRTPRPTGPAGPGRHPAAGAAPSQGPGPAQRRPPAGPAARPGGRPPRPAHLAPATDERRPYAPRPTGGPGRPPRPGAQGRPVQGGPPRPVQGGPPRPVQGGPPRPPRPVQGGPPRPVQGGPPRPGQGRVQGPVGPVPAGPPPSQRRGGVPPAGEVPGPRKIIGLDPGPGAPRPRTRRPAPRKAPRAAMGVKRAPRRGGDPQPES